MVILLDISQTPQFENSTCRDFVHQLLDTTLTPLDRFTILAGNVSLNPTLLPSYSTSVSKAVEWLGQLHCFPAQQQELIRNAFNVLSTSRSSPNGATYTACQSAIVVITDRQLGPEIPPLVRKLNANFTQTHGNAAAVKVFVNSLFITAPQATGNHERNVTCNNSGIWNSVLPSNLAEALGRYNMAMSRSVRIRTPVWYEFGAAPPSQGFLRNGTSLCLPVYNRSVGLRYQTLLGVSCTVLPLMVVERIQGVEVSEL